jgi:hypothetical protein
MRNPFSGARWSNCTGRRHGKAKYSTFPALPAVFGKSRERRGQPKALADWNGLATPATLNQFSVAARQRQRDLASEGGSRTLHDQGRSACRVGQAATRLPSGTM